MMSPAWSRRIVVLALVAACLLTMPPSRLPASPHALAGATGQQDPTASFRSGVNYVTVDVSVTNQQGRPVRGLGMDDFEVYEDGVRQKVSTFSFVEIPVVAAAPTAKSGSAERVEPDVRSNEPVAAGGRVYVLLLDDLHVSVLRSGLVKTGARRFVEQYLGPNDLAAVLHTSGRTDASQEFTTNPRLLLAAIDKFEGRKLRSAVLEKLDVFSQRNPDETTRADMRMERIEDPLALIRSDQARNMLVTLTNLGDLLSKAQGQRKAVVMFSEGLDYELQMGAAQTKSGLTTQTNPDAPVLLRELEQVIRAAARANVTVYGVDPRGLAPTGEDLIEVTTLPQNPLLGLTTADFENE
jgi:VWFA-related protein